MASYPVDEDLAARLRQEIGTVTWNRLQPHAERGVLFLVDSELDLLEVGIAVAEDRTESVRQWLEEGRLARPEAAKTTLWRQQGGLFQALIVKPYIFFQLSSV